MTMKFNEPGAKNMLLNILAVYIIIYFKLD